MGVMNSSQIVISNWVIFHYKQIKMMIMKEMLMIVIMIKMVVMIEIIIDDNGNNKRTLKR